VVSEARILLGPSDSYGTADLAGIGLINFVTPYLAPMRTHFERKRNYVGQHLWARGYFVSTVGRDEEAIRQYIRHQEAEDQRFEQLRLS
jgi:putative transposase